MRISEVKKEKISEQILAFLFSNSPKPIFTSHIAIELARDEEFIKKLLFDLRERKLIIVIRKNSKGEVFSRRLRWKLSSKVYDIYHSRQH
jgi:hypothetical protein